ncbi:LysM peptidoglycan-binding domain-containing protein [Flavobacterium sp. MFBS3-15]|uniref:LysM peptidoglycan-binding domain-containing protein n=1 Tax=Flavobacterium sp. MFBS3-15 TaxID=2989816 RepID=UPI002235B60B|nr:LysM peptidoglycan-binding domain-containing protein [Flavobacterium sp. MFBS3-15]MCW4468028.1 LysM peptidoglycan-binding domain-containing protein [Flavobacterium sp. MFBS3-15]
MKTIILVIILSLTTFTPLNAQMRHDGNQKETEEKIVYHTVALGETVVLIAKSYKIRPHDIYEYNEGTTQGISSGMSLRIPLHRQVEMVNHIEKENDNYDLLKKSLTKPAAGNVRKNENNAQGSSEGFVSEAKEERGVSVETTVPETKENTVAETADIEEVAAVIKPVTHKVVSGENLYRLSLKYNTTVEDITAANKKLLMHGLQVGQVLTIPSGSKNVGTTNADGNKVIEHKVISGETLSSLARKYNTTVDAITEDNVSALKRGLQAGQIIRIIEH